MMAPEVVASMTSLSLMAPTAQWMTWTRTLLVGELLQAGLDGLGGALTSALTMIFGSFISPCFDLAEQVLQGTLAHPGRGAIFCSCLRCSTSSRAMRSSATAWKSSPAPGTSPIPMISTGTEGRPRSASGPGRWSWRGHGPPQCRR